MNKTGQKWNENKIMGGITILLGIIVLVESVRVYQYAISFLVGDHIIPGLSGILLIILGIKLAFFSPESTNKPSFPSGKILKRILGTYALMVIYVIMIQYLGYTLSTLAVSFGLFLVFGQYSPIKSAICALAITAFVYVIFIAWLNMPFPQGIFRYI